MLVFFSDMGTELLLPKSHTQQESYLVRIQLLLETSTKTIIWILFGYSNGSFASPIITSLGPSRPLSLIVADFNKDNQLDIAVVNYGTSTVSVLIGYNNGSFRIELVYDMGYDSVPYSLIGGDFNNDTQLDLAVVNYGTSTLAILLANENGTFTSQQYSTGNGSHPTSLAIGDFNKDNKLDIAVANSGNSNVGIFLGDGNGSFANIMIYSIGSDSDPQFIVVDDLDIVVVSSGDGNVFVLQGNGNGSFSLITTYPTGLNSDPCSIAVGDFDNNNKPDIAITNNGTNSILILTAYSHYLTTDLTTYLTGTNSRPNFVTVGDFNNDNHLDIVVANSNINNIVVFINLGTGIFRMGQVYDTEQGSDQQFISVGDFNNDKQLDIVVAMSDVSELRILLGYGNGTFRYGKIYSTGADSTPSSIAVGDFNKDSYLDIVTSNSGTGNVGIFLGNGDGTFSNVITYPDEGGLTAVSVSIRDFNSDNIY
jgi:hypothetical protein